MQNIAVSAGLTTYRSVGGLEFTKWPWWSIKTSLTFHLNIMVTHFDSYMVLKPSTVENKPKKSKRRKESFVLLLTCPLFLRRRVSLGKLQNNCLFGNMLREHPILCLFLLSLFHAFTGSWYIHDYNRHHYYKDEESTIWHISKWIIQLSVPCLFASVSKSSVVL